MKKKNDKIITRFMLARLILMFLNLFATIPKKTVCLTNFLYLSLLNYLSIKVFQLHNISIPQKFDYKMTTHENYKTKIHQLSYTFFFYISLILSVLGRLII